MRIEGMLLKRGPSSIALSERLDESGAAVLKK
jgi:hypothetical protein